MVTPTTHARASTLDLTTRSFRCSAVSMVVDMPPE
jgi:hypothetical protein